MRLQAGQVAAARPVGASCIDAGHCSCPRAAATCGGVSKVTRKLINLENVKKVKTDFLKKNKANVINNHKFVFTYYNKL